MPQTIDFLESLGMASWEPVWQPVLLWTAMWIVAEGVLFLNDDWHPALRYRIYQSVLFALPVGIVIAAAVDVPLIPPAFPALPLDLQLAPITVFADVGMADASPAISGIASSLSPAMALGAGIIVATALAAIQLARLGLSAFALKRLRRRLMRGRRPQYVGRRIQMIETVPGSAPMTFGFLRPVIALPRTLSGAERQLALKHEIAHIRQMDYPAKWLEAIVAAVFAVHPAAHHLKGRCELLREMTCDATVLRDCRMSRRIYADLLFRFAAPRAQTQLAVGLSMADSTPHVHQRLTAMKSYSRSSAFDPQRLGLLCGLVVLLAASALFTSTRLFAQAEPETARVTLATAADALIIIDGERYDGMLDEIDPSTLLKVEVFKNQEAIDRFGDDARHGAIVITTRAFDTADGSAPPPAETVVDRMPEIIGGLQSITEQLRYTEAARASGVEGRVFVQFIVDEDGAVEHAKVMKGVGAGLDEEALRAVRSARFEPGVKDGKPVRVQLTLPVTFALGASATGESAQSRAEVPNEFTVTGTYPNPFNPATAITFDLPERAAVKLELFDVSGRRVLSLPEQSFDAGSSHTIRLDGSDLASGTYVYRIHATAAGKTQSLSGNLTLVK